VIKRMTTTRLNVGVLGIQGAYARHAEILSSAGANTLIVKYREQLENLDGLIIPGGESTTMTRMMGFRIAYEDLLEFGMQKPIFGTCAGLILIASASNDPRVHALELIAAHVDRNAYGSQKESFMDDIRLAFDPDRSFLAVFIRAPRILSVGAGVRVLAVRDKSPVLIESDLHLGAVFHPELTDDIRIHHYFLQKVKEIKDGKKN
jgi:pyridoxal 5'-phosphate synthase pdxT subunit